MVSMIDIQHETFQTHESTGKPVQPMMRSWSCIQQKNQSLLSKGPSRERPDQRLDGDRVGLGAHVLDLQRSHEERVLAVELGKQLKALKTGGLVHLGGPGEAHLLLQFPFFFWRFLQAICML